MRGWQAFLLQVAAADAGTILAFTAMHQILIAWTPGPLMGLLPGLLPSAVAVAAYRSWQKAGPAPGWRLGVGAALAGVATWSVALAVSWGATPSIPLTLAIGPLGAGLLAGIATFAATRRPATALWSAAAVCVGFLLPAPFLSSEPVRAINFRALFGLGVAVACGTWTLHAVTRWMAARERRDAGGNPAGAAGKA